MIDATCLTIAAILATSQPGSVVQLSGDCNAVEIKRSYAPAIVIEAQNATVRGLTITGSGVVWRGGTIRAPGGVMGQGVAGYGAHVKGHDTIFDGVLFKDANRSLVGHNAVNLVVRGSRFELGQDGLIIAGGMGLDVLNNVFVGVSMVRSSCNVAGTVTEGLSSRACLALGGVWKDGWHQDALQMRNGIKRIRVIGNTIIGVQQGIGQMDARGDLPLSDVLIERNDVAVTGYHSITIGEGSSGIVVRGNKVRQTTGRRTVIRSPAGAMVCGNNVQRAGDPGFDPCA